MRPGRLFVIVAAAVLSTLGAAASDQERVPLYTTDDLNRMFGPAPGPSSDPVDKSTPEDWRWVEQFLDRQYSRIDADRQYDLGRAVVDIAARRTPATSYYGGYAAWGLGYPASTWWNNVGHNYHAPYVAQHYAPYAHAHVQAHSGSGPHRH
jgi:hypothetical protein